MIHRLSERKCKLRTKERESGQYQQGGDSGTMLLALLLQIGA